MWWLQLAWYLFLDQDAGPKINKIISLFEFYYYRENFMESIWFRKNKPFTEKGAIYMRKLWATVASIDEGLRKSASDPDQ